MPGGAAALLHVQLHARRLSRGRRDMRSWHRRQLLLASSLLQSPDKDVALYTRGSTCMQLHSMHESAAPLLLRAAATAYLLCASSATMCALPWSGVCAEQKQLRHHPSWCSCAGMQLSRRLSSPASGKGETMQFGEQHGAEAAAQHQLRPIPMQGNQQRSACVNQEYCCS